jgi:DNA polymerase-4
MSVKQPIHVRKIIHFDLDAFFCSVEELRDPSLRGIPFAVGGDPGHRGVISTCSYAARRFGVHSAMPTGRALKLCPQLKLISGRHADYQAISSQVMERVRELSPLVEEVSIDEAFVDVSDLPESGLLIAQKLQGRIRTDLNLPCSLGVATNKLVAKVATDYGKASKKSDFAPCAIQVVPPGTEAAFLSPLPVDALWGVGPKTTARLMEYGVHTIGELAQLPGEVLSRIFGKNGPEMARRAQGIDDSPVVDSHAIKSVSQETTFDRNVSDRRILEQTIRSQAETVALRLRRSDLCGDTIRIKIRWADFSTHTRQKCIETGTDQDSVIHSVALELFNQIWIDERPVRLLGVGVTGLGPAWHQLGLWDQAGEKEHQLLEAVDGLRDRFGKDVILRGKLRKKKDLY